MKKFYLIALVFIAFAAHAQEMLIPSSFDENRMILKRKDANGNFVPVEENTLPRMSEDGTFKKEAPANVQHKKKKFKKVQKDYSIQKSTFAADAYDYSLPSTFSSETMAAAKKDLEKERTSFVECDENDETCQEYEANDQGSFIFK